MHSLVLASGLKPGGQGSQLLMRSGQGFLRFLPFCDVGDATDDPKRPSCAIADHEPSIKHGCIRAVLALKTIAVRPPLPARVDHLLNRFHNAVSVVWMQLSEPPIRAGRHFSGTIAEGALRSATPPDPVR